MLFSPAVVLKCQLVSSRTINYLYCYQNYSNLSGNYQYRFYGLADYQSLHCLQNFHSRPVHHWQFSWHQGWRFHSFSSVIFPSWDSRIKCQNVPQLSTVTKQPLLLDGLFIFHLCLGELRTCIWFSSGPHLPTDILLRVALTDYFICKVFLSKRKVISLRPKSSEILAHTKLSHNTHTGSNVLKDPDKTVDEDI